MRLYKSSKSILMLLLILIVLISITACDNDEPELAIVEVFELNILEVDYDTEKSMVIEKLNNQRDDVGIELNDGSTKTAEVAWSEKGADGKYDSQTAGIYEFEGKVIYEDISTDVTIDVKVLEEDVENYSVTVSYDEVKGEITGYGDYKDGQEVELKAIPEDGYVFNGWSGYIESDETVITFDMPAENVELTAEFVEEKESYVVNLEVDEGEGVLILADLFGGTPANSAAYFINQDIKTEVITGINLSLLLEILTLRMNNNFDEVIQESKELFGQGMKVLSELL